MGGMSALKKNHDKFSNAADEIENEKKKSPGRESHFGFVGGGVAGGDGPVSGSVRGKWGYGWRVGLAAHRRRRPARARHGSDRSDGRDGTEAEQEWRDGTDNDLFEIYATKQQTARLGEGDGSVTLWCPVS